MTSPQNPASDDAAALAVSASQNEDVMNLTAQPEDATGAAVQTATNNSPLELRDAKLETKGASQSNNDGPQASSAPENLQAPIGADTHADMPSRLPFDNMEMDGSKQDEMGSGEQDRPSRNIATSDSNTQSVELQPGVGRDQGQGESPDGHIDGNIGTTNALDTSVDINGQQNGLSYSENPVRSGDAAIPATDSTLQPFYEGASNPTLLDMAMLAQAQAQQQDYLSLLAEISGNDGPLFTHPDSNVPILGLALGNNTSLPQLDESPELHEHAASAKSAQIPAFAKLEFEDGEFYMTTNSVVLGRDLAAAKAAKAREDEEREIALHGQNRGPHTPKGTGFKQPKSHLSEKSGFLRTANEHISDPEQHKRKQSKSGKKSKSSGSSSRHPSRRNSLAQTFATGPPANISQARGFAPDFDSPVPVNLESHRPSADECPLVPIHPAGHAPFGEFKAISRRHVKIAFNHRRSVFEAFIIGRNGCFEGEIWRGAEEVITLKQGTRLQIGGVGVTFRLPQGVPEGCTGAETQWENSSPPGDQSQSFHDRATGKEVSLDFEDNIRSGMGDGSSGEEDSEGANDGAGFDNTGEESQDDGLTQSVNGDGQDLDEEEDEDDGSGEEADEQEIPEERRKQLSNHQSRKNKSKHRIEERETKKDESSSPSTARNHPVQSPKAGKRGPGRPPKDGVMSQREKREMKMAKKEAKEASSLVEPLPLEPPKEGSAQPSAEGKRKVGRPRKHPRPETPPEGPVQKRKYTKRKPKEPKDGEVKQESDGDVTSAIKKEKKEKPEKIPRSPSPSRDENDYTPEQLIKPAQNYVVLIYEAISSSATGSLSLPQIYHAICRKHPWFAVRPTTTGWQSSVRHNLSQHAAFEKADREGKGYTWRIVPGIPVEKEKKRRTTPPPQQMHGGMYQPLHQAPHLMPYGQPGPGMMGPPAYGMQYQQGQPPPYIPGQHPQYMGQMGPPPQMNGAYMPPPGMQHPMHGQPPNFPIPIAAPLTGATSSYSSPYAPKPNPPGDAPSNDRSQPNEESVSQAVPATNSQQPSAPYPIKQPQIPQSTSFNSNQQAHHQNVQQPHQLPPTQPQPPLQAHYQLHQHPSPQPSQTPQSQHQPQPQPNQQPSTQERASADQPPTSTMSRPASSILDSSQVKAALKSFKHVLLMTSKTLKEEDVDELVDTAASELLGVTPRTPNTIGADGKETQIVSALRELLSRLPGFHIDLVAPPSVTPSGASQADGNQNGTPTDAGQQSAASIDPKRSTPTISRPSMSGQGQTRPRPPMMTPGMKRTNSGGSAVTPARANGPSASPAPLTSSPNGANAEGPPKMDTTQLAGQKRMRPNEEDEAGDSREAKRVSTSNPPQLSA